MSGIPNFEMITIALLERRWVYIVFYIKLKGHQMLSIHEFTLHTLIFHIWDLNMSIDVPTDSYILNGDRPTAAQCWVKS